MDRRVLNLLKFMKILIGKVNGQTIAIVKAR